MSLPGNVTVVTVTGAFVDFTGQPCVGSVSFTPTVPSLVDVSAGRIITARTVTAVLDGSGGFELDVLATDDPDLDPQGWTYRVRETFTAPSRHDREYEIAVPASAPDLDLASVAPALAGTGLSLVQLDVLAAAFEGHAADTTSVHGIADTAALETQSGAQAKATSVLNSSLQKTANLFDLASPSTARTNLGLGDAATRSVGATAGTVSAGDHSHSGGGGGVTQDDVDDTVAAHAVDTTAVHGIADTSALVLTGDSRLSNARTPTAHAASHAAAGADPVTVAQSQVTGLTGALGAKADLVGGKVPSAQIPAIALVDFLGTVASQAAMLALAGEQGDWAIRSDTGTAWVITGNNPTQLASWTQMPSAGAPVSSVNGQTGSVTLAKSDVGLSNVDNTSDAAKPLSTAASTALAGKADAARTITTTAPLSGGGDLTTNRTFTVAGATAGATGVVQLAGDLAGTATAPVVAAGAITDAKVASGAAIAQSKVSGLTAGLAAKVAKADLMLNVRDYGAVGDGTTNDTAAIVAAVAAGVSGGRTVYFPRGMYKLDPDAITLSATCRLLGEHYGNTVLISSNASKVGVGIKITGTNVEISQLWIRGFYAGIENRIYYTKIYENKITSNVVGIDFSLNSYIVKVRGNEITFNDLGILCRSATEPYELIISENIIDNNNGVGIAINASSGGVVIENNTVEGNRNYTSNIGCGLLIKGNNLSRMKINGNWFEANGTDSTSAADIFLLNTNNSTTTAALRTAIVAVLPSDLQSLFATGGSGPGAISITDNNIGLTKYGVIVGGDKANVNIANNCFKGVLDRGNRHVFLGYPAGSYGFGGARIEISNNAYRNTDNSAIDAQVLTGVNGTYVYSDQAFNTSSTDVVNYNGRSMRTPDVYEATDPRWGYVSGTDLAAACQAAINAMPSTGGTLTIPPGAWTLSAPVVLKTGVRVIGAGRLASKLTGAAGVFRWTGHIHDVVVENLSLQSNSGHIFAPSGGAANWGIYTTVIRDCTLFINDPNASIFYHVSPYDYDNVTVADCDMTRSSTATVPAWYVVNSGGAANENRWERLWARSGNATSTPFFWLESTSSSNYAYDNRFADITGEQNPGGVLHAFGTMNLIVDNVVDYDASVTYVADVIKVGRSAAASALRSYMAFIGSCGRRGGTLGGSVYDINLVPNDAQKCTVINPNFSNMGGGLKLNFSTTDGHTILNAPTGAWTGQDSTTAHFFGGRPQFSVGMFVGSTLELAGTGSPEGVVTAAVGSTYRRTDGSASTTLYLKESGAGNTGWVGVGAAGAGAVPTSRTLTAGTGLTGGGDLTADRTFAVAYGTTSTTAAAGNDTRITGAAQKASNLSDLADAPTARTNLGLGGAAVLAVGTTAGTVAAGDDSRFAGISATGPYAGDGTTLKLRPEGAADDDGELRVTNGATGTTLTFTSVDGSLADVNLYRSAADLLRTDDSVYIAGSGTIIGNLAVTGSGAANSGLTVTRGAALSAFQAFVTGDTVQRLRIDTNGKHEWGPGASTAVDTNLYRSAADTLCTDDDFRLATLGKTVKVAEGANAKMGLAVLVAGTVTVSTTAVKANSRIQLTSQVDGGTPGFLRVSTRTPDASFVITSSSATDTSSVAWWCVEPA